MTIQEIIDNRVASIAFGMLCVPESPSRHSTNLDFLAWMEERFPVEYRNARRKVFDGKMRETWNHLDPTRYKHRDTRPNAHLWQYPNG